MRACRRQGLWKSLLVEIYTYRSSYIKFGWSILNSPHNFQNSQPISPILELLEKEFLSPWDGRPRTSEGTTDSLPAVLDVGWGNMWLPQMFVKVSWWGRHSHNHGKTAQPRWPSPSSEDGASAFGLVNGLPVALGDFCVDKCTTSGLHHAKDGDSGWCLVPCPRGGLAQCKGFGWLCPLIYCLDVISFL